jgi:hypothetical protein
MEIAPNESSRVKAAPDHPGVRVRSLELSLTESIVLRRYWVLVVLDQFTRRIVALVCRPLQSTVQRSVACSKRSCQREFVR